MDRAKVQDHSNLERDLETGAIVNTNSIAYQKYMAEKERVLSQKREIEELRSEIAVLRAMILDK